MRGIAALLMCALWTIPASAQVAVKADTPLQTVTPAPTLMTLDLHIPASKSYRLEILAPSWQESDIVRDRAAIQNNLPPGLPLLGGWSARTGIVRSARVFGLPGGGRVRRMRLMILHDLPVPHMGEGWKGGLFVQPGPHGRTRFEAGVDLRF